MSEFRMRTKMEKEQNEKEKHERIEQRKIKKK